MAVARLGPAVAPARGGGAPGDVHRLLRRASCLSGFGRDRTRLDSRRGLVTSPQIRRNPLHINVPGEGFEPSRGVAPTVFETAASTVPPARPGRIVFETGRRGRPEAGSAPQLSYKMSYGRMTRCVMKDLSLRRRRLGHSERDKDQIKIALDCAGKHRAGGMRVPADHGGAWLDHNPARDDLARTVGEDAHRGRNWCCA